MWQLSSYTSFFKALSLGAAVFAIIPYSAIRAKAGMENGASWFDRGVHHCRNHSKQHLIFNSIVWRLFGDDDVVYVAFPQAGR